MIPDLRNTKESPGHSPVTYRKMVGIFCFLLKIHPRRQCIRCLLLLLGGNGGCAVTLLRTVTAEPGVTAAVNDRFSGVLREVRAVGFVLLTVQHAVLADVNAERDADGQQAEENPAGKRFFLLVFYRPLWSKTIFLQTFSAIAAAVADQLAAAGLAVCAEMRHI